MKAHYFCSDMVMGAVRYSDLAFLQFLGGMSFPEWKHHDPFLRNHLSKNWLEYGFATYLKQPSGEGKGWISLQNKRQQS